MITVPVLWVSRHPDIIARGYADCGLLEAMLGGRLWRPPNPVEFEHYEALGDVWPDVPGAVVVLPARHHASSADVAWFTGRLDQLDWSLVILAGDEEWAFPWGEIPELSNRRVWTMQPIPAQEHLSGFLPGGWSPGTREGLSDWGQGHGELDWFFAGQVTHERRRSASAVMCSMERGLLIETAGYMEEGLPLAVYRSQLTRTKVVPCPSGPCTVDTNRPLEAWEAGAVPVLDLRKPHDPQFDYWQLCFGDGVPTPKVIDWEELPFIVDDIVADWPMTAVRNHAWWQQWKRSITTKLHAQIRGLAGGDAWTDPMTADRVTVIVTVSPTSDPESQFDILNETIESVRAHPELGEAEVIVVCDGVRPEQAELAGEYAEFLRRLCWVTNFEYTNVVPLVLPEWVHQANAIRAAMELVTTPYVLMLEQDTPLCVPVDGGEVPWDPMVRLIDTGAAQAIRLHVFHDVLPEHEGQMVDHQTEVLDGVLPLRRTMCWWQRPHLASTRFYRERVLPLFPPESRTYIEDRLYGLLATEYDDVGEPAWWDWRVWLYTPPGDMTRSRHLDARKDDPKYPVDFG